MAIESRTSAATSVPSTRLRDTPAWALAAGVRLLVAIRAWAAASQLGPMPEKEIGRRTGART